MAEQSEAVDVAANSEAVETLERPDVESEEDNQANTPGIEAPAAPGKTRKKRSKKAKAKTLLGDKIEDQSPTPTTPASQFPQLVPEQSLSANSFLRSEVAGMNADKAAESLKKVQISELLAEMVRSFLSLRSFGFQLSLH